MFYGRHSIRLKGLITLNKWSHFYMNISCIHTYKVKNTQISNNDIEYALEL